MVERSADMFDGNSVGKFSRRRLDSGQHLRFLRVQGAPHGVFDLLLPTDDRRVSIHPARQVIGLRRFKSAGRRSVEPNAKIRPSSGKKTQPIQSQMPSTAHAHFSDPRFFPIRGPFSFAVTAGERRNGCRPYQTRRSSLPNSLWFATSRGRSACGRFGWDGPPHSAAARSRHHPTSSTESVNSGHLRSCKRIGFVDDLARTIFCRSR